MKSNHQMAACIRRNRSVEIHSSNGSVANGVLANASPVSLEDDSDPAIERLPFDLLLRIFSFLDVVSLCRCAQVSKKWHELALDGSNWQCVDLFDFQIDIEEQMVDRLSQRCGGFLHELSLKGCEGVGDSAIKTFSMSCHNIEKLILHKCHRITDASVKTLSQNCSKLLHLDLSSCRAISNKSCDYLRSGCTELRSIDLSYSCITYEGVISLVKGCNKLTSISLQHCDINDDALNNISEHCTNLKRLNIKACRSITDVGIQAICNGCNKLESLSISRLDRLTDLSLRNLGIHCPLLKDVEAAGCSHFTDAGFTALAQGCNGLCRMDLEECSLVTDVTLVKLAANCPNLESLVLSHCEAITDAGILSLIESPCWSTLRVLELDNCPLITDQSLEKLRTCTSLNRVEVFDCQLLSRTAIQRLQLTRPDVTVHAYFPPRPPQVPPINQNRRRITCQCCSLL